MFQGWARAFVLLAIAMTFQTSGQTTTNSTNATLTGQWDFNQRNLQATVGTDLRFIGDTATQTSFATTNVNGANGNVMLFPAANTQEGYLMFHGAQPNGGGTNVNVYTLVMDLFWPAGSDGTFRALYSSDTNNLQDAVIFVNPDDQVGVDNDYAGEMLPETWYRLALLVDLPNQQISKYLNGQLVETQSLVGTGVDGKFSLGQALLLFTDASGETGAGQVDRIQFYSGALSDAQIAALGAPVGDGGPVVTGDLKIDSIQKGSDNTVVITTSSNGNLQLQHKAKLTDPNWQALGQPSATGVFAVPSTDPVGFFRLQQL